EVHGTIRWRSDLKNLKEIPQIQLHECDLTDAYSIRDIIKEVKPDYIFHLAAQSFVKASWTNPSQTLTNNIIGELNLLEAVRNANYKPRIMIAGSSEEYGHTETALNEDSPLLPLSPYGVSKVAQDLLAQQYERSYGLDIVVTRAFNHTGPRRGDVFVCSSFAKQIAEIEKGKVPVIHVGNLDAERDFTDVRDIVKAYWLALEKGEKGEVYNICSETTIPIKNILRKLLMMSKLKIEIRQDPKRMRPSDLKVLVGDCTKFKEKTEWTPSIKIEQTLEDLLNYWRNNEN
ncbi:MAG: GDP-mannose 4,6-dehydratase, partial [Promethearchaeota archaeon]